MHKIPRGTSKNAQNYMRKFQKYTKSHEELPKCTQSHEELSNMHNPARNFQKCTKSHEDLPKMHKIP
jgi:aromatic ring hydroxylase